MTPQEVLDKLLITGCIVSVETVGGVLFPVGYARHVGTKIVWATPFPEDQHNGHVTIGEEVRTYHDRDVGVLKGGSFVAYFAPHDEWDDEHETRRVLGWLPKWLQVWQEPERLADFDAFVASVANDT